MLLPTEPIASVPGALEHIRFFRYHDVAHPLGEGAAAFEAARDPIASLERAGSPVFTGGDPHKLNFVVYPVAGSPLVAPGRLDLICPDRHSCKIPRLLSGPFRFHRYAVDFLRLAQAHTKLPVKQAVISPSMLSLMYPSEPIPGYSREQFLADLLDEVERDIRLCLEAGAHCVQIDFSEARLAVKLDPTLRLLEEFIELNNWVLERFSPSELDRIGVHCCSGAHPGAAPSGEIGYEFLLPAIFQLKVRNFYLQLASVLNSRRTLALIAACSQPNQRIFIGVIDPAHPEIEPPELVRERILLAAQFIAPIRLGTTDDCGFAPFADDDSTARETAFAKIASRVEGTRLASRELFG